MTSFFRQSGFTFLEMMVAVVVLAIGAAVVLPNFQRVIASQRVTAGANELVATLQTGRMEAIKRRARVVACPTSSGTACGGSDWRYAIVFVDSDRNGDRDAAEQLVRTVDLRDTGVLLTQTAGGSPARVVFSPSGYARAAQVGAAQPELRVCSTQAAGSNAVVRVGVGSVTAQKSTGGTCG